MTRTAGSHTRARARARARLRSAQLCSAQLCSAPHRTANYARNAAAKAMPTMPSPKPRHVDTCADVRVRARVRACACGQSPSAKCRPRWCHAGPWPCVCTASMHACVGRPVPDQTRPCPSNAAQHEVSWLQVHAPATHRSRCHCRRRERNDSAWAFGPVGESRNRCHRVPPPPAMSTQRLEQGECYRCCLRAARLEEGEYRRR